MGLADRLRDAPGSSQGVSPHYRGKIDAWLDGLSDVDRAAAILALQNEAGWPSARLAALLSEEGFEVSPAALREYRTKRKWERRDESR
jgi:hypothetical protein